MRFPALLSRRDAVAAPPPSGLQPLRADAIGARRIGVSTGFMSDDRGAWKRLLARASCCSRDAVEISALSAPELPSLLDALGAGMPDFGYVAVHAPTKALPQGQEERLVDLLSRLPHWVSTIVVHPDVVDDPTRFRTLGGRVAFENMDRRKEDGRTVDELAPFFDAAPEAGFCLDLAHVGSIDPTLSLADDLMNAFGHRLRQFHVSSLDAGAHHVPLTWVDAARFQGVLRRAPGAPVILESEPQEWMRSPR